MRSERELRDLAARLHADLWDSVGEALYAIVEIQAQAEHLYREDVSESEADLIGDYIEEIVIGADEAATQAAVTVRVTRAQVRQVTNYLEADRRAHVQAHGNWKLDAGKLERALELAGIGVHP